MNDQPEDRFRQAREFAALIGARITFPSDPERRISVWEPANVRETWNRARAEMEGPF